MSDPFQHIESHKRLCENPKCRNHIPIIKKDDGWHYAIGFRAIIEPARLATFDEYKCVNYCPSCFDFSEQLTAAQTALASAREDTAMLNAVDAGSLDITAEHHCGGFSVYQRGKLIGDGGNDLSVRAALRAALALLGKGKA